MASSVANGRRPQEDAIKALVVHADVVGERTAILFMALSIRGGWP